MNSEPAYSGVAIALAWPQTFCKQPGSWYDPLMKWLGFNRHHFYRAGHAAVVLVEKTTGRCRYFDFGRYHAPFGRARVRSAETDHELEIRTMAEMTSDEKYIRNLDQILEELQDNDSCHGSGPLHASIAEVNLDGALGQARSMQQVSPLPYGPFVMNGSNCSRFVRTVILAGSPPKNASHRLRFWMPLTPTPLSNVQAIGRSGITDKPGGAHILRPYKPVAENLGTTLPPPPKPAGISKNAQWLAGEGAGSWFEVVRQGDMLSIYRYSPEGKPECQGVFLNNHLTLGSGVMPGAPLKIVHPSHCEKVTILYRGERWVLKRIGPLNQPKRNG